MKQSGLVLVLVTASNQKEADNIASALLEKRKAACVNTLPHVASRFWWQGKIDSADEILLFIKTKASVIPEVIDIIKKNHSYKVPEIITFPIMAGNPDYLEWIDHEVTG